MIINGKLLVAFKCHLTDIEFKIGFLNTETKQYKECVFNAERYDIDDLFKFIKSKYIAFVGYNNTHVENPYLNSLFEIEKSLTSDSSYKMLILGLINLRNKILSDDIESWKHLKYARNFTSIDLMSMLYGKKETKPNFRMLCFRHKCDTINSNNQLLADVKNIDNIINLHKDEIIYRFSLYKAYSIDVLDKDPSTIGLILLRKMYSKVMNIKMSEVPKNNAVPAIAKDNVIILAENKNIYQKLGFNIDSLSLNEGFSIPYNIGDLSCKITESGIKSFRQPEFFNDNILYIDFKSMFPSILLNLGRYPKHLDKSILKCYESMYTIKMNTSSDKPIYNTLKKEINGVIGMMRNEESYVYDPWLNFSIRFNAVLTICSLLELVSKFSKIIMVNTDSICMQCYSKDAISECKKIIQKFCIDRHLRVTVKLYNKWFHYSINDFIASKDSSTTIDKSGMFGDSDKLSNIIKKAVIQKLVNDIDIEYTVKNCKNKLDFVELKNVDPLSLLKYNDNAIDNSVRYYYSTKGYFITEQKYDQKSSNLITSSGVKLVDNLSDLDFNDIDYRYYIGQANKLCDIFKYKQLTIFD